MNKNKDIKSSNLPALRCPQLPVEAADGALTAKLAGDALITAAKSNDSAEQGLQDTALLRLADAPIAPPDSLNLVGEAILEPVKYKKIKKMKMKSTYFNKS